MPSDPLRRSSLLAGLRLALCLLTLALTLPGGAALAQTPGGDPTGGGAGNSSGVSGGGGGGRGDATDGLRGGGGGSGEFRRFGNRDEVLAIGPPAEAPQVVAALQQSGATLVRLRNYPALGLVAQMFVLPRGLSLAEARARVLAVAPATRFDWHQLYGFAGGTPRLYAASLVGAGATGCAVPGGPAIGMIDGPVATGHPALAGASVRVESLLDADERPAGADHGTAVAALMVGQDASGALRGLAAGARLHAVTIFTGRGGAERADVERVAAAIDRLLALRVRVINLSLAGPPNQALALVLSRAASQGAILIAAAGNDGGRTGWPAAAPDVIAVTAVDAARRPWARANHGPEIELAAPGVDIWAARGQGGGAYLSGTSYAAPIVTALAVHLGAGRGLSLAELRARLRATAQDLPPAGRDTGTGWGLVQMTGCN
ncbi:S8 family serine peptidase [Pseudooceanicola sp. 200-1SW]|uniref:S8 family serine peptidase n=1 Tax=Pseudooceanicola sp. 200-1SW TaxID=3425949 RepID=UPI003D7F4B80